MISHVVIATSDGAVGRVSGRGGLGAGGFEPVGFVLVGQAEDSLGGAEPEQRVLGEQFADHGAGGRADLGGSAPAPGRRGLMPLWLDAMKGRLQPEV